MKERTWTRVKLARSSGSMALSPMARVVLRAEIETRQGPIVTNTTSLSEAGALLATELDLDVGDEVAFRLSFPGLLESRSYRGHVIDVHGADGFGAARAIEVAFRFRAEEEVRAIADVVGRLRESGVYRAAPRAELGYRVLLVEDNDLIADMFVYGVEKYFRESASAVVVDLASRAEAAWTMLSGTRYDLAIVDYYLAGSTGADLVTRMRRDEALQGVPVVAISVGGSGAREASLGAGADLFLDKPIALRDLLTTLARLAPKGHE